MVDKVRKILLALALGIVGLSCYHIFFNSKEVVEEVVLKALEAGIDIEIENFEVVHEPKDGKKWELKADLAQINQEEDLTLLTNVELTIKKGDEQELWVVADSGSIQNQSKNIQLDGNVKMIGASKMVQERVGKEKTEPDK
jgi:LPS export ABC transporter protein LptC